jgi:tetratricopeptide (TPR) repeat protein
MNAALAVRSPAQTIGLCMIVRNEEAVLERCLRSVLGLIHTWVICDTGSTDGTRSLIGSVLADLPGTLHERPWVNFGHNRTELMELAAKTADYLLLIDADMTVHVRAPLTSLSADAYLLRETGELDFAVPRLVRGDRQWRYEGSTHEYLATEGQFRQEQLDELLIEHHADGSSRAEKLLRDLALLKGDLARDPDDKRAVFYLAQTLRDLGKPEPAIRYYRRRVELGGWDEEVFYANLQEGILSARADLGSGVAVLLEAWERRPSRAEPLYELAHAYRQQKRFELARLFAARGLEIPYPDDILFIHRPVYEWGLRLEHALAAEGLGRLEEARADLLDLLRNADLPRPTELYVAQTLADIAGRGKRRSAGDGEGEAPRLSNLAPSTRIGEIELDVAPAWPSFNPSIAADGDGFLMMIRTSNYEIERGVLHADGILQNINYLVRLDADLTVTAIEPVVDRSQGKRRYQSRIQGFEDGRLIEVGGRWYATATSAELNPVERREMALLTLDGARIVDVKRLPGPHPDRHEKNWMPLILDGALHLVYSCGPTVVLRCDVSSGGLEEVSRRPAPALAAGFRGGSQGVPLEEGGHLLVVHEVDHSKRSAQYLHRFVLIDDGLALAAISPPFTFAAQHVEFCAGMARRDRELVLSFGVGDAAAGLAVVSLDEALASLQTPSTSDRSASIATT